MLLHLCPLAPVSNTVRARCSRPNLTRLKKFGVAAGFSGEAGLEQQTKGFRVVRGLGLNQLQMQACLRGKVLKSGLAGA